MLPNTIAALPVLLADARRKCGEQDPSAPAGVSPQPPRKVLRKEFGERRKGRRKEASQPGHSALLSAPGSEASAIPKDCAGWLKHSCPGACTPVTFGCAVVVFKNLRRQLNSKISNPGKTGRKSSPVGRQKRLGARPHSTQPGRLPGAAQSPERGEPAGRRTAWRAAPALWSCSLVPGAPKQWQSQQYLGRTSITRQTPGWGGEALLVEEGHAGSRCAPPRGRPLPTRAGILWVRPRKGDWEPSRWAEPGAALSSYLMAGSAPRSQYLLPSHQPAYGMG